MRISLRGRLALWYLLTIPALVFGLVFIAQQVMVVSLREELDNRLEDRAELTANALSSIFSDNSDSYNSAIERFTEEQLPAIPLLLRVSDPRGQVLATFGDIPDPIVPYLNIPLALANVNEGQFHTIRVKGEETLRVYTVAVETPSASEPLVLIQTGDSLSHITAAEDQLWRYGTGVGIGGAILILAVGFFILQRGFRPLDRILVRVGDIGHGSLHAGLPDESRPPELQQLANSLNTMWRRLHEAFRAREALFASVSHDLRTPLTAIQGQIDVLLMKQLSPDPEVKESLRRIAREVRRLVRMTDDLLLNAQLESNPELTRQAVNLRELVEEVVVDVWTLSEDLELDLPAAEDILISGDYELLKQMVLNIIDNAIKYTSKGGKIKLSLGQTNGWAILEVSDSGIGIPADDLPHVMEPFYRSELSRRSATRGTGLGLAIVKRVVELYDGQIEIESQEGVGTTVKVYLPFLGEETEPTKALENAETAAMR
jgi:two-component system, OmpR family, sensor kinase